MPPVAVKFVLVSLLAFSPGFSGGTPVLAASPTRLVRDEGRADNKRPPKTPKPPKTPPGQSKKNKRPTAKVQGSYELKIAGYYKGSGSAVASGSGISLNGKVKDPHGKEYTLASSDLEVTDDRFRGTGTLGSMDVDIDGRLDPQDDDKVNVLKRGRITLTFRDPANHSSRAAGEMKASEK